MSKKTTDLQVNLPPKCHNVTGSTPVTGYSMPAEAPVHLSSRPSLLPGVVLEQARGNDESSLEFGCLLTYPYSKYIHRLRHRNSHKPTAALAKHTNTNPLY